MSNAACEAVIQEYCRELKLAAVVRDYPGLCRRARDGSWPYEDLLRELLEAEITNRHQSTARRLLREARFPDVKTFDQLDWAALKGVSRPKLMELASCDFIGRAEDVILAGPIGTGKTHLAIALGLEATRRRLRVHFARAADLVQSLVEARDERRLTALQQRYQKFALLIVDELGFVPFERTGGELLFNLLAQRYERRSTIITTNLAFSEWVKVFGDKSSPLHCWTASVITLTYLLLAVIPFAASEVLRPQPSAAQRRRRMPTTVERVSNAYAQGARWRATPNAHRGKDQTITISEKTKETTSRGVAHFYRGKLDQFNSVANKWTVVRFFARNGECEATKSDLRQKAMNAQAKMDATGKIKA